MAEIKKDEKIPELVETDLDLTVKKKKKKKKTEPKLEEEVAEEVVEDKTSQVLSLKTNDEDDEGSLDLTRKKKKRKEKKPLEDAEVAVNTENQPTEEHEYTYEELLSRAFSMMRQLNPDLVAGERRRFIMKPPQCARVGTKKTSFVNFMEICQMLRRQPKHTLAFILAELGASGSVDGNNQLIIKGRFQQKQLESVLRRYIKEYVTCHTCRSPDTLLERDVRLYFLRCNVCRSSCSVATIKSGFQAVTNKRARLRAKANS